MSQRVVRSLYDLRRHGGRIVVKCACGHAARFGVLTIEDHFKRKGWDDLWPNVRQRFRCSVCGSKAVSISYLLDPPCPIGVNREAWARARDDGERKRLIREARG